MIFVNNNFRKTFLLGFFKHVLSKNILPTRGAPGGPPHQPESVAGWIFFLIRAIFFLCKRSLFFDWSSLLLISLLHIPPFSAAPSLCLTPSLFLTGTSQKNTSHRIASHHIASHRIASHHIASHHIPRPSLFLTPSLFLIAHDQSRIKTQVKNKDDRGQKKSPSVATSRNQSPSAEIRS